VFSHLYRDYDVLMHGIFELQFFAASGFPCPHLRNPSDHFLRTVNADFDRVKTKIKGSFKHRVS
jgi:hypothetical protein